MKLIKCFKIHQIIFLLFIAYFGLPHSVFSADYNLFADYVVNDRLNRASRDRRNEAI
jgi:hypothetical protein